MNAFGWRIARRVASVAMLIIIPLAAGASERTLSPAPGIGREIVIERGIETVISRKLCTVVLRTEPINKKKAWISLGFVNLTDSRQDFLENQISARSDGSSLKVYLADDIIRAEKRSQMWEDIATGFVAGVNAYTAGQQGYYTESGTVSGTVRDGATRYKVEGTYQARGFDYRANQAAISAASESNSRMIDELEARQKAELELLGEELLFSQTVGPGGVHSGRFQIELPRKKRGAVRAAAVRVMACGEAHDFEFALDGPASALQSASSFALPSSGNLSPEYATSQDFGARQRVGGYAIVPQITAIYIKPQKLSDGSVAEVVFFDVLWRINQSFPDTVVGKLKLIDALGAVHVAMPWSIPKEKARVGQFEERAVGFPASSFRDEIEWLRRVHAPAISAEFSPDSAQYESPPPPVNVGVVTNSDELRVVGSEFVLVDDYDSGDPVIQRTRVVPRVPGQGYAWMIRVNRASGRVRVREEFTLPIAPRTWGVAPQGTKRAISSDGRTAISEYLQEIENEFIVHVWEVEESDPSGTYVLRVTIEDAPPEVFEFQVK